MRLTVQLCVVVTAAVSVVVVAVEHVDPREIRNNNRRDAVAPLLPEESLTRVPNHRLSSDPQGQHRARQNTYSSHYTQEEPDTRATYWANQRLRGGYHSPGGITDTRYRHPVAATRHESRALQPRRVDSTGLPIVQDSVHDSSPVSRTTTTEDDRFSPRVHQMGLHTSTSDRRRFSHHTRDTYEARVSPASRDRLQRPPPQQNAEIHNRVPYDKARVAHISSIAGRGEQTHRASLAASSRPVDTPVHHRHRAPNTHSRSGFTRGLPTEADAAGERLRIHGFSEISDEVENNVRQRLDQPDQCCGSRVPFDPRTARPTGGFQRVASAGSIKVVQLPDRSSFPPSEVRDLRAMPLDPHTLSLTWTAPGEDLDSGTASGYIIRLSEARHDLQESQFDAAPEETLLETSERLTAAGVYQTAGTSVGVEVPLGRQLARGHVYYVALKALDNDGYSSGVSNMAWFTITEAPTDTITAARHGMTTPNYAGTDPHVQEPPGTTSSRGSNGRNEMTTLSERRPEPPPPPSRGSHNASEPQKTSSREGNSEEQSLLSTPPTSISDPSKSEVSENEQKRRKDRRKKKNKKSKRRKGGRRNGRRRDSSRPRGENSDTLTQDPGQCEPLLLSGQEEHEPVSLCDAQHSLTLAITYFTQNNEHQYLDYLSAALHTLEQKMQPSWRTELRVRRNGKRRGRRASMPQRRP